MYTNTLDVREKAFRYLQELHHATHETVSLYILEGSDRVCVDRLDSPQNVRITSQIGLRLPLYAGSAGKAILAFLPAPLCEEIIASAALVPLTEKTIVDPQLLRGEIEKIRKDGYAVSQGEWLLDASGVAAPLFDQHGEVIAAVAISGPGQRFTPEAIARYISIITRRRSSIQ